MQYTTGQPVVCCCCVGVDVDDVMEEKHTNGKPEWEWLERKEWKPMVGTKTFAVGFVLFVFGGPKIVPNLIPFLNGDETKPINTILKLTAKATEN